MTSEELRDDQLTDEQIELMNDELGKMVEESDGLKAVAELPSNNGIEENDENLPGEKKTMMVSVNPITGEHSVIGAVKQESESFEDMVKRFENSDIKIGSENPITEDEMRSYISSEKKDGSGGILDDMFKMNKNFNISDESIKKLLVIANSVMKKENINVYKELPDEIKRMIDGFIGTEVQVPILSNQGRSLRNTTAEMLINEFISNITINRIGLDFNKEIESLFSKANEEIAEIAVGYTTEKNEALRKYANEKMEDGERKEKLIAILDEFDDAFSLTSMKEYASRCKIKKYELERPDKVYKNFLHKYEESQYNIYDIAVVRPILARHLNTETEKFTEKDIDAFFICFCKQCAFMKPENAEDHAYMYNVIFNITLIDINKGKKKEISDNYIQSIREVIYNLRTRNNNFN